MALVKKHIAQDVEEFPQFSRLEDALEYFHENEDKFDEQGYAIEQIEMFDGGGEALVHILIESPYVDKDIASKIAATLAKMDGSRAPIESIMGLLKVRNAYIRNLGITTLQSYGESIKYYIVKFLIGDDRDLRIFAINVLGDVNFPQSREMLVELLETETDINVAMTAVDYMAEIGEVEDIPLLETVKSRFTDAYVEFAVDNAVRSIRG